MTYAQLTIDGGEVEVFPAVRRRGGGGLSLNQRRILQAAREQGGLISPGQAGKIVHSNRPGTYRCGSGAKGQKYDPFLEVPGRVACCPYAAADGGRVIKRLVSQGMLEKISHGIYAVIG